MFLLELLFGYFDSKGKRTSCLYFFEKNGADDEKSISSPTPKIIQPEKGLASTLFICKK